MKAINYTDSQHRLSADETIILACLSWQTLPDIGVGLVGSEAAGFCRSLFR